MLKLFLGEPQGAPTLLYKAKQVPKESQTLLSKTKIFHSCLKIKLTQFLVSFLFPLEYEAMGPDGQSNHVL